MNVEYVLCQSDLADKMEEYVQPKGEYAYARAALRAAINLLGFCCDKAQLKEKLVPRVAIELPAPALFNAFYKRELYVELSSALSALLPSKWNSKRLLAKAKGLGTVRHGVIKTNDALAK